MNKNKKEMSYFKYMPIVPISNLDLLEDQDGYLMLVQLLKNPKYRDFYLKRDKNIFTILDNGQYEGYNCSNEELWKACELVKPNVVCAPDSFMNKKETIEKTINFLHYVGRISQQEIEIMVIPQGNTPEDFLECLRKMNIYNQSNTKAFTWIGLSKLGVLKAFKNRKDCADFLKNNGYPLDKYSYHFLGCNEPREIVEAWQSGASSMDSCLPVLYASENKIIPLELSLKDRIKTPKDYFDRRLNQEQCNIAYYNIQQLKKLIDY